MKDLFLPRYSPTDSDDEDKLLYIGDDNMDNISEDFSLNEDSLLIPDETQHKEEAAKPSSSKRHPIKTIKSSGNLLTLSKKYQFPVQCLPAVKILLRKFHQQERNMQQDYLVVVYWKLQLILQFPPQTEDLLNLGYKVKYSNYLLHFVFLDTYNNAKYL